MLAVLLLTENPARLAVSARLLRRPLELQTVEAAEDAVSEGAEGGGSVLLLSCLCELARGLR